MRHVILPGLLAAIALCGNTFAADPAPATLPDVKAVPDIDFAKHAPLGAPAISPNGKYIAVSVHKDDGGNDRYQLAILQLPDLKFVSRLDMTDKYLPIDITWVNDKRLVMGTGEETGFSEQPRATGDIIAVDIDGTHKRVLYSDRARSSTTAMTNMLKIPMGFGSISGLPSTPNGHFYLTVNPQEHKTLIFDIDADSGNVKQIGEIPGDGCDFIVHDGLARYASCGDNNLKEHTYYRADANSDWNELPRSVLGEHFSPIAMSADGKQLYSSGNPTGGPNQFAVSNLDGIGRKVLASNPRRTKLSTECAASSWSIHSNPAGTKSSWYSAGVAW